MFVAVVSAFSNGIRWITPNHPVVDFKGETISVLTKKFIEWTAENKIQTALIDPTMDLNFLFWYQKNGRNICPIYGSKKRGVEEILSELKPDVVLNFDKPFSSYDYKIINIRMTESAVFTNSFLNTLLTSIATNASINSAVSIGTILPIAVDTNMFYPFHYGQKETLRKRFNFSKDATVFGVSSGYVNYPMLFNIWKNIETENPNAFLLCLNKLDVYKNFLPEMAKGLKNVIFYPNFTSVIEINEFFNTLDFFLQPNAPRTCQSILEAMSANIPVVVLDTTISRSICGNSVTYIPLTDWVLTKDHFIPFATGSAIVQTINECIKNKNKLNEPNSREIALKYDLDVSFKKWAEEFTKITRRVTPIKNTERVAVICPSMGQVCGIGDYTVRLGSELKKLCNVFMYREYNTEMVDRLVQNKVGTVFLQFEYALFQHEQLRNFLLQLKQKEITSIIVMHSFIPVHVDYTKVFDLADYVLFHGREIYEAWAEKKGADKVGFLSMGVDKDDNKYDRNAIRKSIGISEDANVVAGFGFFEMHKDFNTTARVVKTLINRGFQNTYLLLVSFSKGNQFSQAAESQFYQTLNQLGLDKNFIRVGQREYLSREDVRKYLSCADVVVFSYPELFTNSSSASIRDAMPAGTPVVATDVTFFSEIDCIPKAKGEEELAAQCEKIITDSEYKQKLIVDMKTFCEKNTWENMAKQYYNFIKEKANVKKETN